MKTVSILEDTDTILSGDLVRQLNLSYDGQSDTLLTTNPYGGTRINRLGWITVDEYMPAWIGKTLKEYYSGKAWHPITPLEILRGELPKGHLEDDVPYCHVSSFEDHLDPLDDPYDRWLEVKSQRTPHGEEGDGTPP